MINTRLSTCVEQGFTGGPEWSTLITELQSGLERRNAQWAVPRHRFTADYTVVTAAAKAEILNAYMACRGRLNSFRFKDWNDYSATLAALGNTPGANQTPVQLVKPYTFGSETFTRTITKPTTGSVTVYMNGVAKAGSYSTTTGLFTPTTNWTAAQALTWTGEFDVEVRFGADFNPFSAMTLNVAQTTVELIEVLS